MPEFLAVSLDYAAAIGIIGAAAALFHALFVQARARTKKSPVDGRPPDNPILRPATFAISLMFLSFGMIELVHWHVRSVVAKLLAADANPTLMINGSQVAQPQPLFEALRSMRVVWPHHSTSTKHIFVDIVSNKGSLRLELARDSQRQDEYWVMAPKYWTTATSDVARVQTRAFDQF